MKERRERQKGLLRQEILDAARDILVREGYEGLSMRKVAERIDYSPTAIYLHFKDRDDLVFCVCEQLMAGLVRELQEVGDEHADPLVALKKGLRRYVDFGLRHPQHYQATFGIPHGHNPETDARYQEPGTMAMQAFGFLPRLVAECVKQKKLKKVDVHRASCALWAGVHGITALLIVMPNFQWQDPGRVADQLIAMMIAGLKR
ncbi:MAG TPA: TetR/AcrR family transcriptional regulator [Vicinamibacterales bacterium]|nr:TetR/AcrR family transcriptional regulator [Vicinamibacterales bacterium]